MNETQELRRLVPERIARRHGLLPLRRTGRQLCVGVAAPATYEAIDDLRFLTGLRVTETTIPAGELETRLEELYVGCPLVGHRHPEESPKRGPAATVSDERTPYASANPIESLVHSILRDAVTLRASDVHFEPMERRFRVRCRVDGALAERPDPPKRLQEAIVTHLKLLGGLSIAERRTVQDGRARLRVGDRDLDLRVSSVPASNGESVVLRLLERENLRPALAGLGFQPPDLAGWEDLTALQSGLVLVVGPTGCGKTTTLYSTLQHLNRPDRKIITVEDPVEYQLPGINQVLARPELGLTFGAALRAMLRQSPDVIFVGEIRDRETALVALNAALTGHLVFSTLHSQDACSAILRLADIGAPSHLIASALRGVLAQRLVRRLANVGCPLDGHRNRAAPPKRGPTGTVSDERTPYESETRGQIGIFELLRVDEAVRAAVLAGAGTSKIREIARSRGMRLLAEDAADKVTAGLTTKEEVASLAL